MDVYIAQNAGLVASAGVALLVILALVVVAWLVAAAGRRRATRARIEAERARIDLELSLAEQNGRLRMIRELHEVTVHDVSLIISQADGAQYAGESDPGAAVRAASTIAEAARNTLADLRRVMSVVGEGEAAIDGQPELGSASDILRVMREAGLSIDFAESGDKFSIKPGAEVAIYRILQIALGNALDHGGPGTEVAVSFTWSGESFQLRVDDDGARNRVRSSGGDPNRESRGRAYNLDEDLQALTGAVSGPGITEMRERAELFGGVLSAVPQPGVGFSVTAAFPNLRYHNGVHGVNLDA